MDLLIRGHNKSHFNRGDCTIEIIIWQGMGGQQVHQNYEIWFLM